MKFIKHMAVVALLGLLSGCSFIGNQEATELQTKELPLIATDYTAFSTVNGNVTVEPWDGGQVKAEVTLKARANTMESAKALLRGIDIRTESGSGTVGIRAILPQSMVGSSTQADIRVKVPRSWHGDLTAETTNGNVTAYGFTGDANLLTMNGNVNITDWNGNMKANSTNGNVTGSDLVPTDTCEFGTTNGDVDIRLSDRPTAGLNLVTTTGNATLGLPKDSGINLDMRVLTGSISVSGFDDNRVFNSKGNLTAAVNGGGPRVYMMSTTGNTTARGY